MIEQLEELNEAYMDALQIEMAEEATEEETEIVREEISNDWYAGAKALATIILKMESDNQNKLLNDILSGCQDVYDLSINE